MPVWVFEDKERSWSDNVRRITHVAKNRPGKERHQSRSRLHGRCKYPKHSKGQPRAGTRTGPGAGGRVCRRRRGVRGRRRRRRRWRTSRLSAEDLGGKGRPRALESGERRRRMPSTATTWRLGEIMALGSMGALLPRSLDPRVRGAAAHAVSLGSLRALLPRSSTRDHSRGWREDGRTTTAIEADGLDGRWSVSAEAGAGGEARGW